MKSFRVAALLVALGCGEPQQAPPPKKIRTTYRILSGVSMGGVGAGALGFLEPERFDAIAVQGGPLDAALLLRTIDQFHLGGFCPLSELEAIARADPAQLNDPEVVGRCMKRPSTIRFEHSQDFNHWVFTTNGGTFDRNSYLNLFTDLTLAYGNLLYENPRSPFAPPGVDVERLRRPPADFCTNPVRVKGLYNAELNPEGRYDAITFCDGQPQLYFCRDTMRKVDFCSDPGNKANPLSANDEQGFAQRFCQNEGGAVVANKRDHPLFMLNNAGATDPCRQPTRPMPVALALDINGNGRRDYGEPIIANPQERFDDTGTDGCRDAQEDGRGGCTATQNAAPDPNGDNYDADSNPLGTENDWLYEEGEPFLDLGLDGVASTGDFGEGNGRFDMASGRRTLLEHDARTNLRKMSQEARARVHLLADGGIRDLFNFGLMSKQLFSLLKAFRGDIPVGSYRDFAEIPGMADRVSGTFNPWNARWKTLPRDMLLLYGKEQPTDEDRIAGEGDHVGTATQAANRFFTLFNWAAAEWPNLPRPSTPYGSTVDDKTGVWFFSKALNAKREYAIKLPPGYDLPENARERYPVLYMLHGYGMRPAGFVGSTLITDAYVVDENVKLRPMIIVFPSGACCFRNTVTGEKDCREKDDSGAELDNLPNWERECHSGTFYVNRKGYTSDDGTAYGDSFFELMDYIDQTYRTLPEAEVEAR